MTTLKILDIVDMQNGFMAPDGNLAVKGADQIIAKTNAFIEKVPLGAFTHALVKLDTHFKDEYEKYPERGADGNPFPAHCFYGTRDFNLAIDVKPLAKKTKMYFMGKNVFDMWGGKPDGRTIFDFEFENLKVEKAYQNLFDLTRDPELLDPFCKMKEFAEVCIDGKDVEAVVMGVAADFCVKDAIAGYLDRGVKVTVLTDLTKGIVRQMEQTVKEDFPQALKDGKIRLIEADDFLEEIKRPVKAVQPRTDVKVYGGKINDGR